ncbi:hypothetical protein Gogos_005222, partial [Gossypium gossypioides]|nr:hypothetical protein [Gossypium gossypioides]
MQGDYIISSLLSACLLERGGEIGGEDCVKMHDVIRDMALWITCELEASENNFFVKTGVQLLEEPDVKAWEDAKRMSVMKNKIEVLKETPKLPNLRTLFLSNNNLKVISDGFFQFIPHLTVLDLSENCYLRALPKGSSQLVSLECIDLSWTGISELPMELNSLTKLKMLDLSYMSDLENIPQYLVSSFSKLQIFRLWFKRLLLQNKDYPNEDNVLNEGNEKLVEELRDMTWLILAPNLRNLDIKGCYEMEAILSEEKLGEIAGVIGISYPKPFLKLETLDLRHLPKLKSIHRDALPFPCLKHILIKYCEELKKLPLNSDSAKGNLLSIKGSKDWWARVEWENEVTRDAFLPSFKL